MIRLGGTVAAVLLASGSVAMLQPEDAPSGDPADAGAGPVSAGSLEVSAQLWAVIARYRFGATADRVRVTVARANGRSDMHSLIIRCVPGAQGLARIELQDITLVAERGVLRAVHERDPTTYFEAPAREAEADPASVLRSLLPPLTLPQLSLAFDPGDVEWCPLVTGVRWESAERIAGGAEGGVRLMGTSSAGRASLDLVGGRVRRFEGDLGQGSQARIVIECEPVEPGDPADWGLDTRNRRRLDRLSLLRPLGSALAPGERWPAVQITLAASGEAIDWPPISPEVAGASNDLWALVLLSGDEGAQTGIHSAIAGAGVVEARREMLRGRIDGRFDKRLGLRGLVGVVAVDQEAGTFDRVHDHAAAWDAALAAVWPDRAEAPALAWTPAETRLMDRLAPGAACVLVLVDGRGEILAAVPVGPATPPEEIARALVAGLPEQRAP